MDCNTPFLFPSGRLVSLTQHHPLKPYQAATVEDEQAFRNHVQSRVIGCDGKIQTPFGEQKIKYFDFTASGRFHKDIEEELNEYALPYMANTHSETSATARIITGYYHNAFQKIAHYVNANDDDILIPVGSGSTGAINRLIHVLGLRMPDWCKSEFANLQKRPLVMRSLMEHHSNDIAWRETIADLEYVAFQPDGTLDLNHLEELLKKHAGTRMIIGTFSAASNVTGIRNDTTAIARVLHQYGAFAFFDYAAAAPHVAIDMHPDEESAKDAVFISTHKFIGGPRTPGLLIANRALFQNTTPIEPGGGTVLYTSPWDHRYLPDITLRETGGTPPIMQSIQAGLVFDLKARIGIERIETIESDYLRRAIDRWRTNPNLMLLGRLDTRRLGIVSVVFRGIHHELAVALLNDRYGIQVRGGCMCAGPYGHELLHIDEMHSKFIRDLLDHGRSAAKPGWVRISLGATVTEEDFRTLLEAVEFVAQDGKRLESEYAYEENHNTWQYRNPN